MTIPYLPLQAWNKHWKLRDESVYCQQCGYSQHLVDPHPFKHAPHCPHASLLYQSPGRELGQIIEQKIKAGLF